MQIQRRNLPCDKATFLQKLNAYVAAMQAHASTEGVPAPFPEFEIFRTIFESGETLEILQEVIVGAVFAAPDNSLVKVSLQGLPPYAFTAGSDPYMAALLAEWGGTIAPFVPVVVPVLTPAEKTAAAAAALNGGAGSNGIDIQKLLKAKFISDLAFRLNVAPGALTPAQLLAERNRIAAIYAAL